MNPLTAIPPRIRLYVYAVLALAAIVVAAVQASDGDWLAAIAYVVAALGGGTAASNVDTE